MIRDDASPTQRTRTQAVPAPRISQMAPWPEPGRSTRSTRPRSEYWDVESARWTTRSPLPAPRRGE